LRVLPAEPPAGAYYLLVFGEAGATIGLAAVDASTGEVSHWATLPGAAAHPLLDERTAIERAGARGSRSAELVWASSPASRSPLYPLWRIQTGDKTVYVDQHGTVWPSLGSTGRGG
jgi:hypothetical protein